MIEHVSFERTTFERPPLKFEAGTPDYIATHGLAKALDYVSAIGMDNIRSYEQQLTNYALEQLRAIDDMPIYGHGKGVEADAVVSFNVADIRHADIGTLLDQLGISVRTGHHCAQPFMDRLGVLGTVRASFSFYNTFEEVDALAAGLRRVIKMF